MSLPSGQGEAGPGLQAERTALSWRRTGLSVTVGSLVALRLLPSWTGSVGYVIGGLGLLWALDLTVTGHRRYEQADLGLRGAAAAGGEAGSPVTRTAVVSLAVALVALAIVVIEVARG